MSFCDAVPHCVPLSLSDRRQTGLFAMINPTAFHHKPNGSFIGFICFPVFQHCYNPRNVTFVLWEITETFHVPSTSRQIVHYIFLLTDLKPRNYWIISLPLTLAPWVSHPIPDKGIPLSTSNDEVLMWYQLHKAEPRSPLAWLKVKAKPWMCT